MSEYKQYQRKGLSEMRPYKQNESMAGVSISDQDLAAGSPKENDMIARNPKNHDDKWLVAEKYFNDNLEPVDMGESEAAPRTSGLNFGQAIEALKQGKMLAREGWNGSGLFIFKQIPANIGQDIIPKMQSVPQETKDIMIARKQNLNYRNQCVIVDSKGNADNWVASISDCFAEDWAIL